MVWLVSAAIAGSLNGYNAAYYSIPYAGGANVYGGFAGDLNGDGTSEVWIADDTASVGASQNGMFELFRGGPFQRVSWTRIIGHRDRTAFGQSASLRDVNGDGVADLLIGGGSSGESVSGGSVDPGRLYVFFGPTPNATLLASSADVIVESSSTWVMFGPVVPDLTGDGQPDMVAVKGGPDEVVTLDLGAIAAAGRGVHALDAFVTASVQGRGLYPFSLGDLDGDGLHEVTVHDSNDSYVIEGATLLGGTWQLGRVARIVYDAADEANGMRPGGDLNLDGQPDVLITTLYAGGLAVWPIDGAALMALPLGQRRFALSLTDARSLGIDGWAGDVVPLGDVSGDGLPDWAVGVTHTVGPYGYYGGPGELWIVEGDGDLSVTGATRFPVAEPFRSPRFYDGVAQWLDVGQDCDGDGLPDLLVSVDLPRTGRWAAFCY